MGCRSKWLKQFAATLRVQTARYRHQSIRARHAPSRDVAREQEAIVRAVLARDADQACTLPKEHFARTAQLVLEGANEKDATTAGKVKARTRAAAR
ncbi:FCD domain-containing protein [Paraburkholderia sp. BL23I1N1]|uniref:FCD domain-containing protein n=1 Tax=Paraburkholderia sp. BL23I1N1 TaxID=1938802 RepID=UPI000E741296|nr:FCD domain-containing protein [Paraburkholderia sp. BL23I1N1]